MTYTNRSIFLCTFVFEINFSTKHIRSFQIKRVKNVVTKGKDVEQMKNDKYALKRALFYGNIGGRRYRLIDIEIEKYICESFVD